MCSDSKSATGVPLRCTLDISLADRGRASSSSAVRRRLGLTTRGVAIVPAIVVAACYGIAGMKSLLVFSQVLLRLQRPSVPALEGVKAPFRFTLSAAFLRPRTAAPEE